VVVIDLSHGCACRLAQSTLCVWLPGCTLDCPGLEQTEGGSHCKVDLGMGGGTLPSWCRYQNSFTFGQAGLEATTCHFFIVGMQLLPAASLQHGWEPNLGGQ
jgi:hypothetical protein